MKQIKSLLAISLLILVLPACWRKNRSCCQKDCTAQSCEVAKSTKSGNEHASERVSGPMPEDIEWEEADLK